MSGSRLKYPFFYSLSGRILFLGLVAGIIPLVLLLIFFGMFSHALIQDLHTSLSDLKAREGQRLENYQLKLIQQQIRQKALDVAQDITGYIHNHPTLSWKQMLQDPAFRDLAVQPAGTMGETFLLEATENLILVHRNPKCEGQPLTQAMCLGNGEDKVNLEVSGSSTLKEISVPLGHEATPFFRGFLVPVLVKPTDGPQLMVGAWLNQEELALLLSQSRAILKTALNVTDAIIQTRMGQYRHQLLLILVFLGIGTLFASLSLVRSLTKQVKALTLAAEAFDQGNLGYRIKQIWPDELGQLARTLNRMAASLNENTISRMEWENTFNILPDQVIMVDHDGRVTRLNQAAALYHQVFPQEVVNRPLAELMRGERSWFPDKALSQALKEGRKTQTEVFTADRHTFLVTVDPWYDAQGGIGGAVLVGRDITALKRIQGELAKASDFLQQLIESAPLGFLFINSQGLITQANTQFCKEFGYALGDILNRHCSMLYVDQGERGQVLKKLKERGEVLGEQVEILHRNGSPVPARLSIRTVYDKDGNVLGSVVLVSNITEEVNLQRQLEQAQRQEVIATLAGGLAHNFNNLLMIIMGLTSLILGKVPADHPVYDDLKEIERQVRAGREITRKLLAFRRGESFETRPVNLNQLVEATADMFARTRQEVLIQKEFSPDLPAVEVDFSQIQQVVINLLINAWQAMPEGGKITLKTRAVHLTDWEDPTWDLKPGQYVCLSVSDTGIGMDEETVRHLFSPFFTTKEPGQGSGLGLASAYRIIKKHRGAIQVVSTPGKGSTFTLFLPASSEAPLEATPEEKRIIMGHGTIMVVEDEPTLRRVSANLLKKLGYQVVEASCGEQALEIYAERRQEIDLVLLDMIMPGLNGLQTLENLKRLDPDVRVILCSGMGDEVEENLPAGVSFIPKPVPIEILSQKVAQALMD